MPKEKNSRMTSKFYPFRGKQNQPNVYIKSVSTGGTAKIKLRVSAQDTDVPALLGQMEDFVSRFTLPDEPMNENGGLGSDSENKNEPLRETKEDQLQMEKLVMENEALKKELQERKSEKETLKKELELLKTSECPICYSSFLKTDQIYFGDCGHGCCRSCFQSWVVTFLVKTLQYEGKEVVWDFWSCFFCRTVNSSYVLYYNDTPRCLIIGQTSTTCDIFQNILLQYDEQKLTLNLYTFESSVEPSEADSDELFEWLPWPH